MVLKLDIGYKVRHLQKGILVKIIPLWKLKYNHINWESNLE